MLTKILGGAIPETPSHDPIPWTPVAKPLANAKVALLSTAGISMKGAAPAEPSPIIAYLKERQAKQR